MPNVKLLPAALVSQWEWQLNAACRELDSALFFHPDNERGAARANRVAEAQQICRSCPVLEQCRKHALTAQEPYGIWGGQTEDDRRALVAGRRRQPA
jgi:WhiB family redox-sensing transcriptional regulator